MRILSLSFFAGTLILLAFSVLPDTRLMVICGGLVFISAAMLYFKALRTYTAPLMIVGIGFLYAYWQASYIIDTRLPQSLEGKDLFVEGIIEDMPVYTGESVRFIFAVNTGQAAPSAVHPQNQGSEKNQQQASQKIITGKMRIAWYRDAPKGLQAGDRWQLQIRAKRPNGFMNPGGRDYEKWLFTQRITATAYVRRSDYNHYLGTGWAGYTDRIREYILEAIHRQITAAGNTSSRAIIAALAVAWRNDISDPQWETLRRTGTSHLVAISGLHIGLVAGFGFFIASLVGWCFPRLYLWIPAGIAGGIIGSVLALLYALLAGFTLPTQRALLMVLMIMAGLLYRRSIPFTVTLSGALLAVLLFDPLATLSAGFWLSFLSVFMIFLLSRRSITRNKTKLAIVIQLGISLGMIPLTACMFGSVSLVSAPANLVAVPYVSLLVVPLVLLGVATLPFSEALSSWLWNLAVYALDALLKLLDFLASFDWAAIHLPQLPLLWVLIASGGFLLLILPKGIPGRWLGLVLMAPVIFWQTERPLPSAFQLTVLDVGQGLASAIQTANHVLIYDTGPKPSESFDAGRLVVLPWLRAQGYRDIDMLIVSHADNDHSGGAPAILAAMPVEQVLSNSTAILHDYPVAPCLAGKQWNWDGVHFEIIHPSVDYDDKKRNNRACVLRVSNDWHSVLLTADIERPAEYALSKQSGRALRSEVLVVPHHGSKSSSSPAFLKKVEPELAIVTTGYRNRFNHPHPSVVKRYHDWGIPLLGTVDSGAIRVNFPASTEKIKVHQFREQQRGFWNRDLK